MPISLLLEAPEPFWMPRVASQERKQLLEGKDAFVVKAGKHGLLYAPIDDNRLAHATRVGRQHLDVLQNLSKLERNSNPEKEIHLRRRFTENIKNSLGKKVLEPF